MPTQARIETIRRVVAHRQRGLVVVLEDIHDPHNAEAVLRTCDAVGVQDAYFVFEREEYYDPKRIGKQSSGSANKWMDCHIFSFDGSVHRTTPGTPVRERSSRGGWR